MFSLQILSSSRISILLCRCRGWLKGRYQERREHSCWELREERRSLIGSKGRPWGPRPLVGKDIPPPLCPRPLPAGSSGPLLVEASPFCCFCNLLLSMVRPLSALKLKNKTHLHPAVAVDSMVLPSYLLGWACQRADSAHRTPHLLLHAPQQV